MSDQKNIDRLFREKFKDFDPTPNEALWSKINARLDEKSNKRRRVIPLWWRLGGIAATIALLFTLGYYLFTSNIDIEELPVTNTKENEQEVKEGLKKNKDFATPQPKTENNETVVRNDSLSENKNFFENDAKNMVDESKNQRSNTPSLNNTTKEQVVNKYKAIEDPVKTKDTHKIPGTDILEVKEKVVQSEETSKNSDKPVVKELKNEFQNIRKPEQENLIKNKSQRVVIQNTVKEKIADSLPAKNLESIDKKKEKSVVVNVNKKEEEKKSIYEAIIEKEPLVNNDERAGKRWSINPAVAPVYYNTLGEGSPIHSQFADNSKSGNVNMSYGINVAYELNSRLSIRSGINRVNLGYETNDIAITSQALQAAPISTISYANNTANLRISDRPTSGDLSSNQNREINAEIPGINGILTQELGYLEVPLELKYRLTNKKLGINLIGGFSSLFLTDNSINVVSGEFITNVGDANNLNSTSFSTNIGFGVDYKLSDKLLLSLEPIFKYQINTFSSEDGGFRPYTIGVYTGFSFRF